jgi:hypothetical protein
MSQTLTLKAKGLYTSANSLTSVPEGSLSIAKNVVIDHDDTIESRRGFLKTTALPNPISRVDAMTSYQGMMISHRQDDNKMSWFNGAAWTDYAGIINHPDSALARIKFADMNGNKYFTTANGIMVLDSYAGPIYATGLPKGLDGTAATNGVTGWMANNSQIAYRIVWGANDVNTNLYLGAPSQRIIVANSSGNSVNIALTFTVPAGITTADFYQVYRSAQSATSTTEPNDEMQLVYESNPANTDITNKFVSIIDSTPDSLKGAYLYTDSSQEGISESNDSPPFAKDITVFKGYMFYAGIKTKFSMNIKMLACGGTNGLVNGDTVTIDSMIFSGQATEVVASKQFKIFTTGSAAQNIDNTAKSMVEVINQAASNTSVYAYYVTGYGDLPGQILISRRDLASATFSASVSRASAWDIGLGTAANSDYPHGYMWSKNQAPEHVPNAHLNFAGSKNSPIRRIIALRDSVIFLKDDGIFRLTGSAGNWDLNPLDTSTHILAPESAAVHNNQIFALTDQGIVTISDLGVAVISRPIEDQINNLIGANYTNLQQLSFGISYETDRKYILYTINSAADSYCTQAFVYNTFTKAWVTWDKPALAGFVNKADNLLYTAMADDQYVLKERKSFTFRDFIDEEMSGYSIVSSSGNTIFLNTVAGLTIGDLVNQSLTVNSPITAIDASTNSITLKDVKTWTPGATTINKAIQSTVEWVNQACGNPGMDKHFQECVFLFRQQNFITASASFYTELSGGYQTSKITGVYGTGLWGSQWGSDLWGGISRPKPLRVLIPREKSRGTLLSVKYVCRQGYSQFALQGLSLIWDTVSERENRD